MVTGPKSTYFLIKNPKKSNFFRTGPVSLGNLIFCTSSGALLRTSRYCRPAGTGRPSSARTLFMSSHILFRFSKE